MEKNTILAIVLSTAVLIISFIIQGIFFAPKAPVANTQTPAVTAPDFSQQSSTQQSNTQQDSAQQSSGYDYLRENASPGTAASISTPAQEEQTPRENVLSAGLQEVIPYQEVVIETELLIVTLTNTGGDMISWKLKEHLDNNENVDMIFSGTGNTRAFSIAFGDLDAQPVSENFLVNQITPYIVEFSRDFIINTYGMEEKFKLIKRYEFKPNEYMFELAITLDGGFSKNSFNFFGNAYTLSFGPQIGPKFNKLDRHYEYRQYFTFINGKRKNAKLNEVIDTRPAWAAITGKYFTFISIPYLAQYKMNFSERAEPGLNTASRLYIQRPAANISKIEDMYRFYLGPRSQNALVHYNNGKNGFDIKDANLIKVSSTNGFLAPLETVLKWLLVMFYGIVKNYGIAIILLTLLIKILFFPLTKKGSEATLRMQALSPKIKELQDKYKTNPQKLQTEMANLYKQEGYNPLSGCLPMLLQLPIFIAMYSLFNNHFDLRGAMFIPGWIPDLSAPEAIWNFPGDFRLPILGWTALRALPFIYVGSQLLYGKVTQMPGQQSQAQMKMMLYIMPIVFFFILYDVPSGLLVYWIFSNLLTLVQQVIINKYIIKKRAAAQAAEPEPVITRPSGAAPKKKKK